MWATRSADGCLLPSLDAAHSNPHPAADTSARACSTSPLPCPVSQVCISITAPQHRHLTAWLVEDGRSEESRTRSRSRRRERRPPGPVQRSVSDPRSLRRLTRLYGQSDLLLLLISDRGLRRAPAKSGLPPVSLYAQGQTPTPIPIYTKRLPLNSTKLGPAVPTGLRNPIPPTRNRLSFSAKRTGERGYKTHSKCSPFLSVVRNGVTASVLGAGRGGDGI